MKIVALNKYYFVKGGTERYLFDIKELLERHGHMVVPFAMQHPQNQESGFAASFVPYMETGKVDFSWKGIKAAGNFLYNFKAKSKLKTLLQLEKPSVAHVHNVYHQLSSSVLDVLRQENIPTVMTIHDYHLISPNYSLFHDGQVCERGIVNPFAVIPHRCIQHSYLASTLSAIESALVRVRNSYQKTVSRFIVPSQAAYRVLERAGWDMKKCVVIPHFLDLNQTQWQISGSQHPTETIVFVGRLSAEKGVDTLIAAAKKLPKVPFVIIGTGPYEQVLKAQAAGLQNVRFKGWLQGDALRDAILRAAAVVVPSLHHEVFGYSALEAMALQKPVIASRMGALPELVQEGNTGFLFTAGNADELAQTIARALQHPSMLQSMGIAARQRVAQEYSPQKHFARIMEVYSDALADRAKHALWT